MDKIVFMLKTYKKDYCYYSQFVETFRQYNVDNIKLYVVVPKADVSLFYVKDDNIKIVAEEELPVEYFKKGCNGYSAGYLNQQIVKLAFWELGLCENYFCIDADYYFIKKFYERDFIYHDDVPYTVFYDDRELMYLPSYYNTFGKNREKRNRIIAKELELGSEKLKSCHACSIFSRKVLENFKQEYMGKKNLTYKDVIKMAPIEFTWYNYWLLKTRIIEIYDIAPLVKYYHIKEQLQYDIQNSVGIKDLKRNYIGVGISSFIGREKEFLNYEYVYRDKSLRIEAMKRSIAKCLKKSL